MREFIINNLATIENYSFAVMISSILPFAGLLIVKKNYEYDDSMLSKCFATFTYIFFALFFLSLLIWGNTLILEVAYQTN